MTESFEVFGNHGTLLVCAKTGLILDRLERIPKKLNSPARICPDSWEDARTAFGNAQCAYDEIVKFDVEEFRSYWAAHGLTYTPATMPNADILDIGFWTFDGAHCEPEEDWREQIRKELKKEPQS